MKQLICIAILLLIPLSLSAQYQIRGYITDELGTPLPYVNIFLQETFEGSSSDENGYFTFTTHTKEEVTLTAMMLGYETISRLILPAEQPTLTLQLRSANFRIKEVEIVASNFSLQGSSQWKTMHAVDLVTTGGSVGDLYKSIATLPGSQIVGESGKLFIRGGESRESQTYIDDMHVLNPYTTTSDNDPVRGRYSPFMFEGMSFSLGGYDPEYSQGLSSILPLTTKNESPVSKFGINPSTVGIAGGGTKAFRQGSISFNTDYQNLGPYYKVFPDNREWITPYQKSSTGAQFRYEPDNKSIIKLYTGYDRTWFEQGAKHNYFNLLENNYYLNTTYRRTTGKGYQLFAGAAFSRIDQQYRNVLEAGDLSHTKESEAHIKIKISKRYSSLFKLQAGAETMIRMYDNSYKNNSFYGNKLNHGIPGIYATGSFYFSEQFNLALSSRLEYTTINNQWEYMPRIAFNYQPGEFHISAIAGKYHQLAGNDYLVRNTFLPAEMCTHYILGSYHQSNNKIYRLEAYYKKYDKLALVENESITVNGNGYSKGIDAFFSDASLINKLEYRLSYSLNFSERLYQDHPVKDVPQYASRHNLSLSLKYDLTAIKSIIGITNRYASGRPYHDPNHNGYMNNTTPHYNSLDLSITWLAHPKVIVYGSASNILGRRNIFNYNYSSIPDASGYYAGTPVKNQQSQFFYIGIFITLGGKTAYDVSNF